MWWFCPHDLTSGHALWCSRPVANSNPTGTRDCVQKLIAETVTDPRWFPMRFDAQQDEFRFIPVGADMHRAVTFLADVRPSDVRVVPRAAVNEVKMVQAPLHMIVHTGLGGSTLLARALAQPGIVTTFKEPPVLTDMVAFGLHSSEAETRGLIADVAALLSRPFAPGETLVCKMSSIGNGLAAAIAEIRADTKILCLRTPLELMLASLASRGEEGRMGGRRLYNGLQNARMTIGVLDESQLAHHSDLQLAALAWLSVQRMIGDLGERFGPSRVRSLTSETFLARPSESLRAIAEHFGLSLDVEARLASGVFNRHAKTGAPFDAKSRARGLSHTLAAHADEIGAIVQWTRKTAESSGVALGLPHPFVEPPP